MITEDEYKAIKLENNLDNLNKDIELVNEELEQIKKLIFVTETDYLDDPDESFNSVGDGKVVTVGGAKKFRTE